jgi:hypothetical protein
LGEETFGVQETLETVDYYKILGSEKTATFQQIKKDFRKAAIKWYNILLHVGILIEIQIVVKNVMI